MSKIFKKIFIALFAIIVIILTIPFFVPINNYKPTIEKKITEYTKRDFKINGNINFAVLPDISIKINRAQLRSLTGFSQEYLISVDQANVILELSSLLKGKVVVKAIALNKPEINLEIVQDKKNWEIGDKANNEAPTSKQDAAFIVENIKITDAIIRYIDNKQVTTLTNINFNADGKDIKSPIKADYSFNLHNSQVKGDVNVKGNVDYFENIGKFNASIKAIDSNFEVKGQIDLSKDKPKLIFDIKTAVLDLSKLMQKNTSAKTERWSSDKINLAFLNMIDAAINFDISKLKHNDLTLNQFKAKVTISENIMQINNLNTGIFGGNLSLSGAIKGATNQNWNLKVNLKNADLKSIAPPTNSKFKVTKGLLNLTSNINSAGNSVKSYVNNLVGTLNIDVNDGQISGINLGKIVDSLNNLKDIKTLPTIINLLNGAIAGGTTDFKSLRTNISIKNGIATIQDGILEADAVTANATGYINLPNYTMNIDTKIAVSKFPAIGVNFHGAVDSPAYKLDLSALRNYFTDNAVNSVIEGIGKGKVKPKDIIKGIIGGDSKGESATKQESEKSPEKLLEGAIKNLFK